VNLVMMPGAFVNCVCQKQAALSGIVQPRMFLDSSMALVDLRANET
jgi:hypothetical protein